MSEEDFEIDVKYCNSQYSSVLQLANKLKKEEAKRQAPNHQNSTFSIDRKKRAKVEYVNPTSKMLSKAIAQNKYEHRYEILSRGNFK